MEYRYFSSLKLLKSLIDSQPLVLRELILIQINCFLNRLIVTKVDIKLSVESRVHPDGRANSQKAMELMERCFNLLIHTKFHEITPILIQILVSQITVAILNNEIILSTNKNIWFFKYFSRRAYSFGEIWNMQMF